MSTLQLAVAPWVQAKAGLETTQSHNVEYHNTPKSAAGFSTRNTTDAVCREDFCSSCASLNGHLKTCTAPGCLNPTPHMSVHSLI